MKKYEEYKESKNIAIGLIPSEWNITSIKNILEIPITDGPHTTPEFYDEGIPFLSAEAVKGGKLDFNRKRGFISEEDFKLYSQKYVPEKGDIFMVKSGATTGNTAMVETDDIFNIWSPLAVFRANNQKVYPKYLHYYLMSPNFKSLVEISWSYGTQQNIGMGVLSNLPISYPTIETQTYIAKYLDNKTAIIDALLEKKEQLIKKLQAQRQAIISESVTKGLDPNAKMKDSGIEWLGDIPAHWVVSNFKYFISLKGRLGWKGLKAEEYVKDSGYGFLSTPDIKSKDIDFKKINHITKERYEESPEIMLEEGDVLLVKDGSTLGITNIIKKLPIPCTVNSSIGVLKVLNANDLNSQYLLSYLRTSYIQAIINLLKAGQGVPHLFQKDINNFSLILPPLKEQLKITEHLEIQISRNDSLIDKLKSQIKKLKTYRQAIISEAVTGKIDVRDWQPPTKN